MRIGIAGFMHESNSFGSMLTDLNAFHEQSFTIGPALVEEWKDAHHEVGGFLKAAEELGFEAVPLLMAWATPSGPVTEDAYEEIAARLRDLVMGESLDGLLLALHGAMVAVHLLDADGETVKMLREALGPEVPLVVTLDFHGNISERLIEHSTAVVAYQTNPHVDQRECGRKAALLLVRHLKGEVRLTQALVKPPVLINIMKQNTSEEPLRSHLRRAREAEKNDNALSLSLMAGFAYADVPQMGPSIIAVTDDDRELALDLCHELSEELVADREKLAASLPQAEEAVRQALGAEKTPVVLVDTGDNVGGGSAADGTVLLREMLAQGATRFVVCLFDPEAVRACDRAGVGATVQFTVGGKSDRLHGEPVEVEGEVKLLHDGSYVEEEVRHGGKRVNHMGRTALVELPGESLLVLNSLRHPPFSLGQLTCLGIRPEEMRILVVKAAIAYRAAYGPIAGTIIEVATPGVTAIDPSFFEYRHAPASGGC